MPPRRTLEQKPRIIVQAGAHGGIEIKLFQHVLLRVAAAQAIHFPQHRPHQLDSARILAPAVRKDRLGHRQRDCTHKPRVRVIFARVLADSGEHPLSGGVAARVPWTPALREWFSAHFRLLAAYPGYGASKLYVRGQ